jgi:hypothetical protein
MANPREIKKLTIKRERRFKPMKGSAKEAVQDRPLGF